MKGSFRSLMMKGLLRLHPRKGKPVARLGRKAQDRAIAAIQWLSHGSRATERMLAIAADHVRVPATNRIGNRFRANARLIAQNLS
jgi:hypothetical protein